MEVEWGSNPIRRIAWFDNIAGADVERRNAMTTTRRVRYRKYRISPFLSAFTAIKGEINLIAASVRVWVRTYREAIMVRHKFIWNEFECRLRRACKAEAQDVRSNIVLNKS
jgi:hypothetical protein